MNVPIWMLLIAPPVLVSLGFLACAMLAAARMADDMDEIEDWLRWACLAAVSEREHRQAHARCSDSRNTLLSRIDRLKSIALSQQSVKSGRIVAVLNGEA